VGSGIRATHLFLVGDIFDFWLGGNDIFVRSFSPIVDHLRRIAASGVETHYFEGNHDLYLEGFWQNRLGIRVHVEPCLFRLGGLRVRVEHGDLLDPADRGYRFLRRLLRSRVVAYTGGRLPGWLLARIGVLASRTSRSYTSRFKTISDEHARATVRDHARTAARQGPFDLIVTGHVHIRDDYAFELEGRTVRSVNLGSWAETPCVFRITGERQEFVELPLVKT
jgi:UDP-2,3-diacylglucosamine hydrolase